MHRYRANLVRKTDLRLPFWMLSSLLLCATTLAQSTSPPPFGSNLDVTRSRIGDERVQRQSELLRLERRVESLDSRMVRLERQQLRSARLPGITLAEATAEVVYAETQLDEREKQFKKGEATRTQIAGDRLALARARGQLDSVRAAFEENLMILELELGYSQRRLLDARSEKELLQRLVAKGYTSGEALTRALSNENLAEKEYRLFKIRLETLKRAAGQGSDNQPETVKPDPNSDEAATESATEDNT